MKTFPSLFVSRLLCLLIGILFTLQNFATVGGPQTLEILGFNEQENSVLFLRHKNDAEGLPPQLWAFRLGSGEIEVMADASKYYDNDGQAITKELKTLEKTEVITPSMLNIDWQTPIEVNDTVLQFEYTLYPAKVKVVDHTFDIVQCFKKDKPIEITEQYYFEQSDLVFVIFQHFGICLETGYTKDTLLVSTMSAVANFAKQEEAEDTISQTNNSPSTVEDSNYTPKKDNSLLWTLSIMVGLAFVYLFLRMKSGRNRVSRRRRK